MSARHVRKKRTRLLTRRRLNAMPAGGKLIPTPEPVREPVAVTASNGDAPAKS
jgi:hypothetical protein